MSATSVFFICEGDHLTAQGLLLAASLRFHNADRYNLNAYLPGGDLPDLARRAFDALNVDLRPLEVPRDVWKKPFPHGNKIFACAAARESENHVFLDSDMVCVAPLDIEAHIAPGQVALVPEGTPTWGKSSDRWARVYGHFGLPLPEERIRLVRRRRIEFLPYFNAGMVAFHSDTGAEGRSFADLWLETACSIDHGCAVAHKRPWLDQIALPVTLARFGIGYNILPDIWNFSISERAFEPEAAPKLIHYHSFRFARHWPQVRAELARMRAALGPDLMVPLDRLYAEHWDREPEPLK